MVAGVAAANLPDIDLVYTWITPAPLGYLLHHRGHTHTLAGLGILFLLGAAALRGWPAARNALSNWRGRMWGLVAINLAGHVSLDALNSYGVHPFYPFNARWYYGDAVFIFEPLVWVILGTAAASNASRVPRTALTALLPLLLLAVALTGIVPLIAVGTIAAIGALFFAASRNAKPRTRSGAALAACIVFVFCMIGGSRLAKSEVYAAVPSEGEVLDVVVSPDPAMPVCWSVIVVARAAGAEGLRTSRGTLSLAPEWYPPETCASNRLARLAAPGESRRSGKVAWRDDFLQPVRDLRELSGGDCWVAAWLQFGRAPILRDGAIMDLRFESGVRGNFTAMPLERPDANCPPNVPRWRIPRADVVGPLQ